jgi:hypothetical protein
VIEPGAHASEEREAGEDVTRLMAAVFACPFRVAVIVAA